MATKTIAFFGASTGVGLSALRNTLAAGHRCIALCRTPSTLTNVLPLSSNPNLTVVAGNAHDIEAASQCLKKEDGTFVDAIVFSIGAKFVGLTIDDPEVCRKGMAVLLEAVSQLRQHDVAGRPRILVCSTTGISRTGRDLPLLMLPLYYLTMKVPHADKKAMELALEQSGEDFTIVRCSLFMGGETDTTIRVGVEDPKSGRESVAIGYTISREDAGKWFAEHLIKTNGGRFLNKIATITY
ncbi:fungal specific transcription factor domain-containing protein [Colletotrichum tofieldiae]|uniref:Fungal specific transcription factor domain-containing protein n=1 Tax=Colletotrichum tofieldiae TaxID=708197 RepID=A0A166Y7X7_9PEZI|nr:fungal specific transcription factor domain-containing protein [Colletotrichum tofieldiae]GKT58376.1 fungal specific transcription factor domain-containing protein [Colletotrichum tofieldiae]GKT79884.1 fungal specific transcription factor domain-containing protein [Colletotrichum tofieldiae]GKT84459.1 fungal specific transcription factor domain-containing protein [Colletotrichum tofieldiae]